MDGLIGYTKRTQHTQLFHVKHLYLLVTLPFLLSKARIIMEKMSSIQQLKMYCKQCQENGGGWEGFTSTEAVLMQLTVEPLMFTLFSAKHLCSQVTYIFKSKISCGVKQAVSVNLVGEVGLGRVNFLIVKNGAFSGFIPCFIYVLVHYRLFEKPLYTERLSNRFLQ